MKWQIHLSVSLAGDSWPFRSFRTDQSGDSAVASQLDTKLFNTGAYTHFSIAVTSSSVKSKSHSCLAIELFTNSDRSWRHFHLSGPRWVIHGRVFLRSRRFSKHTEDCEISEEKSGAKKPTVKVFWTKPPLPRHSRLRRLKLFKNFTLRFIHDFSTKWKKVCHARDLGMITGSYDSHHCFGSAIVRIPIKPKQKRAHSGIRRERLVFYRITCR